LNREQQEQRNGMAWDGNSWVAHPADSPLQTQVGGDHYKKLKIQPVEYMIANNIGFCEGCVIKYVTRWKDKGGVEDLKKARHFLDMLIASA
jgi:hypothetical protein